jgi:hypothetical protein
MKLPAYQTQALALYRGYKSARDQNDNPLPKTQSGFAIWLARYDILFSEKERRLWVKSLADIVTLFGARSAPSGTRISKNNAIQWLLVNHAPVEAPEGSESVIEVRQPSADDLATAQIFWEPYHTTSELLRLAQDSRQRIISETGSRSFSIGQNYWFETAAVLRQLTMDRGLGNGKQITSGSSDDFVNLLQIYDATQGIDPVVDPRSFSPFHGMSSIALLDLARQYGYKAKSSTKEEHIAFLISNAPATKILSEENSLAIAKLLLEDIAEVCGIF